MYNIYNISCYCSFFITIIHLPNTVHFKTEKLLVMRNEREICALNLRELVNISLAKFIS